MAKAKPKAVEAPSRWEANCMFCGQGITDEGAGFLDHIAGRPGCQDAHAIWVENLQGDWGGGD